MERQNSLLAYLRRGVPSARKQGRQKPWMENRVEYEAGSDIDEWTLVDVEIGIMRDR